MAVVPADFLSSANHDQQVVLERWRSLWSAHAPHALIANASVEADGLTMRPKPDNRTWVTSLWDHFGTYPLDEIRLLPRHQQRPAFMLFGLARAFFPKRILRDTWLVDNQPVSTPLWTDTLAELRPPLGCARRGLRQRPPVADGEIALPSRMVWIRPHGTVWRSNDHRDARLERNAAGEWRPITEIDLPRAAALYHQLYLGKYSQRNPAYTATFLRDAQASGLISLEGLFIDEQLAGVIGPYRVGSTMTTPILGYDLSRPLCEGLYRRLTHRLTQHAEREQLDLHRSGGAGGFKRLRGCQAHWEWIWIRPRRISPGLHALRLLATLLLREGARRGF